MDTIVGFLVLGGLIWVVLTMLVSRGQPRGAAHPHVQERRASAAAAPSPRVPPPYPGPALAETPGEAEALADGLVIGRFLKRHHCESRIEQVEQGLDEFDALAGHSVEPWYDALFDLEDGED